MHTHTHTHTHACALSHSRTLAHTLLCSGSHTNARTHTCPHMCAHTCIHPRSLCHPACLCCPIANSVDTPVNHCSKTDTSTIVRELGGHTVHPPPPPPFHHGPKMYLRVSRTQSHLFPGQPLGCTRVTALCARVPSCVHPGADCAQVTTAFV